MAGSQQKQCKTNISKGYCQSMNTGQVVGYHSITDVLKENCWCAGLCVRLIYKHNLFW